MKLLLGSAALELLPTTPTRARKITTPLVANDGVVVPIGYVTDGASIPRLFWSLIGHPFEGRFIRPALDHDIRCEFRVGPWRDVHRRFFATLKAEGIGWLRRSLMFLAVRFFGPRWSPQEARSVDELLDVVGKPVGPNGLPWGVYPAKRGRFDRALTAPLTHSRQ